MMVPYRTLAIGVALNPAADIVIKTATRNSAEHKLSWDFVVHTRLLAQNRTLLGAHCR